MCMISQEALDAPNVQFFDKFFQAVTDGNPHKPDDKNISNASVVPLSRPAEYGPFDRKTYRCPHPNADFILGGPCPHCIFGGCELLQHFRTPYMMRPALTVPAFEHERQINLIEDVHVDMPPEACTLADNRLHHLFDPTARASLLNIYDKYLASYMRYSDAKDRLGTPDDYVELSMYESAHNELDYLADTYYRSKLAYYGAILHEYIKAKDSLIGKADCVYDPYCFNESPNLSKAYELAQYRERLNKGEPVIFQDGRCLFEAYVMDQGYRPGPFPGLEFYTYSNEYVDSFRFSRWLEENLPEREQDQLPPVGYFGFFECSVGFADILKFYHTYFGVLGPETFRTLKDTMPKTWKHCL